MKTVDSTQYQVDEYMLEIIEAIVFYEKIAQKGSLIRLPIDDERLSKIPKFIFRQLLYKLAFDFKAFTIHFEDFEVEFPALPPTHPLNSHGDVFRVVYLEIDPDKFEETAACLLLNTKALKPDEREKPRGIIPVASEIRAQSLEVIKAENKDTFLLAFNPETCHFTINGHRIMRRPQFGNDNYTIACYVFKHPRRLITFKEIQEHHPEVMPKSFHKWADALSMPKNIKSAFFNMNDNEIALYPEKTYKEIKELNALPLWQGQPLASKFGMAC